ncbi:MAG: glycosyltransferase WbuB [Planctomycetota bacterium]|nr:MAG: glycosyltransferase WbuB [Planctomycetota bacterium]
MTPTPLRILILVHNMAYKGGAFYHGLGFAKTLAKFGHQVTLLSIHAKNKMKFEVVEKDGIRMVNSPDLLWGMGRTGWCPWDTMRRMSFFRGETFDILHTVDTRPAVVLPALYLRKKTGGRFIADWTDWWARGGATSERKGWAVKNLVGPLEKWFEEKPKNWADGLIAISQALYQRAKEQGISDDIMCYLPPGSDTEDVPVFDKAQARADLKLDPDRPILGYLGNIYQRDADLLFATLRKVAEKKPDTQLVMIGHAKIEVPQDLADGPNLLRTGRVPFPDMVKFLGACDVLTLPLNDTVANRGRWPSKINDYMAAGRPIVANAIGDLTMLFQQAEIGHLAAPEPGEFADRVLDLLNDPQAQQRMGNNARKLAETEHSWEAATERLVNFYHKILNKDGVASPKEKQSVA